MKGENGGQLAPGHLQGVGECEGEAVTCRSTHPCHSPPIILRSLICKMEANDAISWKMVAST